MRRSPSGTDSSWRERKLRGSLSARRLSATPAATAAPAAAAPAAATPACLGVLMAATLTTIAGMGTEDRRRGLALYVLCAGMLMIVLDATIVNVALPTIQKDLGFSQ